jgi:hypothetical protein
MLAVIEWEACDLFLCEAIRKGRCAAAKAGELMPQTIDAGLETFKLVIGRQ